MELEDLIFGLNKLPCRYRLHTLAPQAPNNWSDWIICPVKGIIETGCDGPFAFHQVTAIEIDPIEKKWTGKRVPEQEVDHSREIIQLLQQTSVSYKKEKGMFCLEGFVG